jgi:hypothetical protein
MKFCKICKNVVRDNNGTIINLHSIVMSDNEPSIYLCFECEDIYFMKEELKCYEQMCKKKNIKPNPKVIDKIKATILA